MTKSAPVAKKIRVLPLYKLLPSIITLVALCAGLTAVKFSLESKWENSAILLVIAAFLDDESGIQSMSPTIRVMF